MNLKVVSGTYNQNTNNKAFEQFLQLIKNDPKVTYRNIDSQVLDDEGIQLSFIDGMQISRGTKFDIPDEYRGKFDGNYWSNPTKNSKYLWVLDKTGIKIIRENSKLGSVIKDRIRHTNLTGGGGAYLGGEVWFNRKTIRVNAKSSAYCFGNCSVKLTEYEYNLAMKAWRLLGYKVKVVPINRG